MRWFIFLGLSLLVGVLGQGTVASTPVVSATTPTTKPVPTTTPVPTTPTTEPIPGKKHPQNVISYLTQNDQIAEQDLNTLGSMIVRGTVLDVDIPILQAIDDRIDHYKNLIQLHKKYLGFVARRAALSEAEKANDVADAISDGVVKDKKAEEFLRKLRDDVNTTKGRYLEAEQRDVDIKEELRALSKEMKNKTPEQKMSYIQKEIQQTAASFNNRETSIKKWNPWDDEKNVIEDLEVEV